MTSITDEAGMCVVDIQQIQRRLSSMDQREANAVSCISVRYLWAITRLAHTHNLQDIRTICTDLTKLIINDILSNENRCELFKTFKEDPIEKQNRRQQQREGNRTEKTISSIIESVAVSAFDPSNVLSFISQHIGGGNEDACIEKIPDMLKNFNPFFLEEIVWLRCCSDQPNCACRKLSHNLDKMTPVESLVTFLLCMNHKKACSGVARFEAAHSVVSRINTGKGSDFIRFPLRDVLFACIGGTNAAAEASSEVSMATIAEMSIEDRAFVTMVYSFLFFSRYSNINTSGDLINRILYTVCVRFILRSSETLFCEHENASRQTDGGRFLVYLAGYLPSVIMSGAFAVEKAFIEWCESTYAGSILSLVHNKWRNEYSVDEVKEVSKVLINKVAELGSKSRYIKTNRECSLGSTSAVRNMECYLPYGSFRMTRARNGDVSKAAPNNGNMIGLAKRYSNGNNMPCNVLSVLPTLPPLAQLGTSGRGDQARFEISIFGEKACKNNFGRLLGFITCMLDRVLSSHFRNIFSNDKRVNEEISKAISQAVSDCMFDRSLGVDGNAVSNVFFLPRTNDIDHQLHTRQAMPSMDMGGCAVFLPWKRPVIPSPNVNALGVSQLELTLSRDPKWAPVITQLFFFIERIAAQITQQMMKNLYGPNNNNNDDKRDKLSDRNMVIKLLNESIKTVKSEWLKQDVHESNDSNSEMEVLEEIGRRVGEKRPLPNNRSDNYDDDKEGSSSYSSSYPQLDGVRAGVSTGLFGCLRDICINADWDPATIIGFSQFLVKYSRDLDDFVTTLSSNSFLGESDE